MWKYYQASEGYSIVINVYYIYVCVYSTAKIN